MNWKIKPWRIAVIIAYIVQIVLNASAGATVGNQSDRFTTLITPAGYTFAIWGLIFTATLAYTVYQALPRTQNNRLLDQIAPYVVVGFVASGIWVPLFVNDWFVAANVVIAILLIALIGVLLTVLRRQLQQPLSSAEQWLVAIPFYIYAGWATIATVANIALTLTVFEWGGWGISETVWAIAILLTAGLIAGFVVFVSRGNLPYTLTLVWALTGIIVANLARPQVLSAAVAAMLIVVGTQIYAWIKRTAQPQNTNVARPA